MLQLIVFLTTFALLMFSLVFDWCVQTVWESTNKFKDPGARAVHSFIYATLTAILLISFPFYKFGADNITWIWGALLLSHYVIDSRKAVMWWMVHVKRMPKKDVYPGPNGEYPPSWWLQIGIDQCFHITVNFILAIVMASFA